MARVDDILKRYGFERNSQTVWQVQGNSVIYHHVLESIARDLEIKWQPPTVLRADREECVLLVWGTMDDRLEWSIGEALVGVNYRVSGKQAAYVYAMAEKRAKDRLIYKFLGLQEQFDDSAAEESQGETTDKNGAAIHHEEMTLEQKLRHNIGRKATLKDLEDYVAKGAVRNAIGGLGPDELGSISNFIQERRAALSGGATSRDPRLPIRHGDGATVWDDQLSRAKTALAKAKNAAEVDSYESLMVEQEFGDAPADVIEAFRDLCESRRYGLK